MSTSHSLQASLLVAALMAFGTAHAADNMSKADYKAEKDRIASTYKTDKDACGKMSGNAKDVCVEEAKAKEKIAKAELEYKNYVYLTLTGRNDWTSTIPRPRNSFFYPSISTSFISRA